VLRLITGVHGNDLLTFCQVPALQFPVIMYSIFTNVAFTFGPVFQTTAQGEALVKQLLESFLTAFAISTGVNLFIIPVTSRTVVFKEQSAYIGAIRGTIKAQRAYLESLETTDMFSCTTSGNKVSKPSETPQAKALKAGITGLTELHGKLYGDLPFGKRETAWGKLCAEDMEEIFSRFRAILIPLIGMSTITDIFERVAIRRGWVEPGSNQSSLFTNAEGSTRDNSEEAKDAEKRIWNEVMKTLHEPFSVVSQAMDEGLEHAGVILELLPSQKKPKAGGSDEEERGSDPRPGDKGFADYLEQRLRDFYAERGVTLKAWARARGLSAEKFDENPDTVPDFEATSPDEEHHNQDRQQLYLVLYMEHLLYSTGMGIAQLVRFADSKIADGTMKKKRLIFPGIRRIKRWIGSIASEDSTVDNNTPDSLEAGTNTVYREGAFKNMKKDPEHLPPKNAWERFGNRLRCIPRFLGSTESAFGFRVACATLTIGIVAFLKDTQVFFIEQRLVWAMIIIAIGMTVTAGQSVFGLVGRVVGTALSMVLSIVIWYIVDAKTP
jgi:hypothetical protein